MVTDQFLRDLANSAGINSTGRIEQWKARYDQDEPLLASIREHALSAGGGSAEAVGSAKPTPMGPLSTGGGQGSWAVSESETIAERVIGTLERIDEYRDFNIFTQVFASRAVSSARRLDERLARGQDIGILGGAIVAVKDIMGVDGGLLAAGTRAYPARTSPEATVVRNLRAAGAVVVGTTNLHALAYGPFSTNDDYGAVRNPLSPFRVAGGSSGGSAAAVAAGLVDIAVGTDTAGSIRMPAALCGVVGMKPSFGLLSCDGTQALAPSLDHIGPLTRNAGDALLALRAMYGAIATSAAAPHVHDSFSIRGLKIGMVDYSAISALPQDILATQESAQQLFQLLGAEIVPIVLGSLEMSQATMLCTIGREALATYRALLASEAADLMPGDVRLRLEAGMFVSAQDYSVAQNLRGTLRHEVDVALRDVDFLMMPTMPHMAPELAEVERMHAGGVALGSLPMNSFTAPFSLTGHPAVSLPWSIDRNGAGIGVQFIGAMFEDARLLQFAAKTEDALLLSRQGLRAR